MDEFLKDKSLYDSEMFIEFMMDIDPRMVLGVFSIIRLNPNITFGEYSAVIAAKLDISPTDLVVTYRKEKIPDSFIISDFLAYLKIQSRAQYMTPAGTERVLIEVAKRLEEFVRENDPIIEQIIE